MKRKVVLTGGPCSGKTTLINELLRRGHRVLDEVAREVLAEREEFEPSVEEWKIKQRMIHERQRVIEEGLGEEGCFLDRGLIDGIAYSRKLCGKIPYMYSELELKKRYDFVFILERLPFQRDEVRWEDEQDAEDIHQRLLAEYRAFGYEPISVPVIEAESVEEAIQARVDFILNHLENYHGS